MPKSRRLPISGSLKHNERGLIDTSCLTYNEVKTMHLFTKPHMSAHLPQKGCRCPTPAIEQLYQKYIIADIQQTNSHAKLCHQTVETVRLHVCSSQHNVQYFHYNEAFFIMYTKPIHLPLNNTDLNCAFGLDSNEMLQIPVAFVSQLHSCGEVVAKGRSEK